MSDYKYEASTDNRVPLLAILIILALVWIVNFFIKIFFQFDAASYALEILLPYLKGLDLMIFFTFLTASGSMMAAIYAGRSSRFAQKAIELELYAKRPYFTVGNCDFVLRSPGKYEFVAEFENIGEDIAEDLKLRFIFMESSANNTIKELADPGNLTLNGFEKTVANAIAPHKPITLGEFFTIPGDLKDNYITIIFEYTGALHKKKSLQAYYLKFLAANIMQGKTKLSWAERTESEKSHSLIVGANALRARQTSIKNILSRFM